MSKFSLIIVNKYSIFIWEKSENLGKLKKKMKASHIQSMILEWFLSSMP